MKLALIDLSNIFWQSWHATAGQDVDASYRVSLERVTSIREGYDAVCVCCDIGKTWRHDVFPQYKGNRPPRDAAAYDQLRRVREQLEADGVPVVSFETYEADDIIATLACKAPANGYDVEIHSGDKDLCQLVGPSITVISTNNGNTRYDEDKVREKFRVNPAQLGDFLALVGDKSDNIAGCPGCGEVNAARLLTELGSLANMLEMPDAITPPKMRENIVANKQAILLARRLVSLRTDVPLDFEECTAPRAKSPAPEEQVDEKQMGGTDSRPGGDVPLAASAAGRDGVPEKGATQNGSIQASGPTPNPGGSDESPETGATSAAIVLDRSDPKWSMALEPRDARGAYQFAVALHKSQLYRKFPNADAIFAVILRGRSMGIDMMTALDGFHVIEGKPSMSAMLVVATVLNSGKAEYFELVETTDQKATWETLRKGGRGKPVALTFSIEDAQRAGLVRNGGNWTKYPRAMCRKQAGIELARSVYPDVVCNVYDGDELQAS